MEIITLLKLLLTMSIFLWICKAADLLTFWVRMITCFLKTKDNTITLSWAKKSSNYLDPMISQGAPNMFRIRNDKARII